MISDCLESYAKKEFVPTSVLPGKACLQLISTIGQAYHKVCISVSAIPAEGNGELLEASEERNGMIQHAFYLYYSAVLQKME